MRLEGRFTICRMIDPNPRRPSTKHRAADTGAFTPGCPDPTRRLGRTQLSPMIASLALCIASLGGCSHPVDCGGGNYRGGCFPGAQAPDTTNPAVAGPASIGPSGSPAGAAPANVARGEPAAFADMDDKQCRSYGLLFGSHDYADCRIKLSAQHRGLDPNIGATTPGPPGR